MLVPLLTTLAGTALNKWEGRFHRFLAVGVAYRAISTYSRGGFLACGGLILVYIFRSERKVMALMGVLVAAMIIFPVLPDYFWERMETIKAPGEVNEEDTSALGRLHFWDVAVKMANARPLLGVGHWAYNITYDEFDDTNGQFGHNRSVHSAWFGILAELGYPGLLLFIAQLVLGFRACAVARRAAKLIPDAANLGRYAFSLEAAFVAFAVGGSFVPFQYTEMLWHLIGLSISLQILAEQALKNHRLEGEPARAARTLDVPQYLRRYRA
jgi:probable O-glycosylation ligase (exosortase A-associated)